MKNVKTFDQLLDEKYGKKGNIERDQFDADSLDSDFPYDRQVIRRNTL